MITYQTEMKSILRTLERIEIRWIKRALTKTNWNKEQAARLLGLKRTTLVMKCKKYGLMKPFVEVRS